MARAKTLGVLEWDAGAALGLTDSKIPGGLGDTQIDAAEAPAMPGPEAFGELVPDPGVMPNNSLF